MMSRSFSWCLGGLAAALIIGAGLRLSAFENGLISDESARRLGLEVEWLTHVSINPGRGHVAYLTYHIDDSRTTTLFEVSAGSRKSIFSQFDPDPFGDPMGIEGAQRMAEARAEVLRLEGADPQVQQIVLPEFTIYAISDESVLHAIDGESGATRWALAVGDRHHPAMPIAADNDFISVVNGMTLYVIESQSGRVAWTREIRSAPGSGAAMTSRYAFVPLINGRVEAFPLWDAKEPTQLLVTVGMQFVAPFATERTISWPNDRGQLNVAYTNRLRGAQYRLQADRDIVAPATAVGGDHLVVCSSDGYVHCIQELNGNITWAVSTGVSMRRSPVAVGNTVFAVCTDGSMYQIAHPSGDVERIVPGISQFLAASDTTVYCLSRTQELFVINRTTGTITGRLPVLDLDLGFVNPYTDRIYLGSTKGPLQCLHEIGRDYPYYHTAPDFSGAANEGDEAFPFVAPR